jgi:superfamily II RNA helicase
MKELIKITLEVHENSSVILPYIELKRSDFYLQQKDKLLQDKGNELSIFKDKIESIPNFEDKFYKIFKQKELEQKKQELLSKLSVKNFENYSEYESRVKVLKELNYIDNEDQGKHL